jgi:hypothetical protein
MYWKSSKYSLAQNNYSAVSGLVAPTDLRFGISKQGRLTPGHRFPGVLTLDAPGQRRVTFNLFVD